MTKDMTRDVVNTQREKRSGLSWWRLLITLIITLILCIIARANYVQAASPAVPTLVVHNQVAPDHDGDDDDKEFVGQIVELPTDLQDGNWVVGGETFVVSTTTELKDNGQTFAVGVKVKVHYTTEDEVNYAREIEIKSEHDDDDDHEHDDDDIKIYARLESRPDEKVGVWVIGGTSYTVTESTELEDDHGALVVGICVEVEVRKSSPTVAKEIESEEEYKCSGHDEQDNSAHGQLFGVITALPADLQNGNWEIGGKTFVVSPTTELKSKGFTFAVGVTVKVKFTTDSNNVNYARRIEFNYGHNNPHHDHSCKHNDGHGGDDNDDGRNDDDDDHYGYGNCPGKEGKSYGLIIERPVGTTSGEWNIGGIVYLATERTEFRAARDDDDDDLLLGERVRVEYVVNDDGSRRATKIKETDDTGGVIQPGNDRLVGFVEAKPTAFIGTWMIAGAEFTTTADTLYREQNGVFAIGSYVVVEYSISNDQRVVHAIATHIPPGTGDESNVGRLEAIAGARIAALPDEASATWTVNGQAYVVTAATQVVENGEELVPGSEVYVNSYTVDGQKFATMIRAVSGKAFMPMLQR